MQEVGFRIALFLEKNYRISKESATIKFHVHLSCSSSHLFCLQLLRKVSECVVQLDSVHLVYRCLLS